MRTRWNQQNSHGGKWAICEKKRLPPVAIAATTKAAPELVAPEQVAERVERPANAGEREHADDDAEPDEHLPHDAEDGKGHDRPCVIGRQGIRRGWGRYPEPAGVAELVRRARLKIGWPSGRAGSSPAPGIAYRSARDDPCSLARHGQGHHLVLRISLT